MQPRAQESQWVDVMVVVTNSPMQAHSGRRAVTARSGNRGDGLASTDACSGRHDWIDRLVSGSQSAVLNHHDATTCDRARERHLPGSCRPHVGARRCGEVDSAVAGGPTTGWRLELSYYLTVRLRNRRLPCWLWGSSGSDDERRCEEDGDEVDVAIGALKAIHALLRLRVQEPVRTT